MYNIPVVFAQIIITCKLSVRPSTFADKKNAEQFEKQSSLIVNIKNKENYMLVKAKNQEKM